MNERWSIDGVPLDDAAGITVEKWSWVTPVSFGFIRSEDIVPLTRRQRLSAWLSHAWWMRPRVHLGGCDHDDCY